MSAPETPRRNGPRGGGVSKHGGNRRFKKGHWRRVKRERQAENRRKAAVAREEEKKCRVCREAEAKYKCPTCRIPFCSVACSKVHKQTPCTPPPPPEPVAPPPLAKNGKQKEEDEKVTLTDEQRRGLDNSEKVQSKMKSARLRRDLAAILGAADPGAALSAAMQDEDFVSFCDDILEATAVRFIG